MKINKDAYCILFYCKLQKRECKIMGDCENCWLAKNYQRVLQGLIE